MHAPTHEAIRAAVARDGLAGTARALGVQRSTLASYLSGACREGTILLMEARFKRLPQRAPSTPLSLTGTDA